jgi:UTP--glucose-1-phosphate uridylyltransferase
MIKKAIITAAGKGTRQYPATNAVQKELFPLVDRDGITKPTIQVIVEEVMNAGIEEIAVIVQPGEERQFKQHFAGLSENGREAFRGKPWGLEQSQKLLQMSRAITYIHQNEQRGFGHAVFCANEWAGSEPTLLLLGDHVYLSHEKRSCVQQVIDVFAQFNKSVFSVQRTPVDQLHLFGVVSGRMISSDSRLFELDQIVEKPGIDYARQHLCVPKLPPDVFLAIFGIYVLTPTVFQILAENIRLDKREHGEIQLTTALAELIAREGVIGYEASGQRLDMGTPLGYLQTQLALATAGPFRSDLQKFMGSLTQI